MAFVLAYETNNQTYYLTNKNGWILSQPKRTDVRLFKSVKAGRAFYNQHHQNDARAAFANRKLGKMIFIDQNNESMRYPFDPQQRKLFLHHVGDTYYKCSDMADFIRLLKDPNNHIMILDLEFYQNSDDPKDFFPQQIAGQMFNGWDHFNSQIFDYKLMNPNRQLEFLQKTDLPYSAAKQYTLDNAITQLKNFIHRNKINMVISWDNNLDFYILNTKVDSKLFKGLVSVDLANTVADVLSNGSNANLVSLKAFTQLLNLPHTGRWHDAADDVEAINKICLNYYNSDNLLR